MAASPCLRFVAAIRRSMCPSRVQEAFCFFCGRVNFPNVKQSSRISTSAHPELSYTACAASFRFKFSAILALHSTAPPCLAPWRAQALRCRHCSKASALIASPPLGALVRNASSNWSQIAQLELSMVLLALTSSASTFRAHRGVWFIDNVAASMALIRGRSDSPDLERLAGLAHLIHVALFALRTWMYWEWIPSKSGQSYKDDPPPLNPPSFWTGSQGLF